MSATKSLVRGCRSLGQTCGIFSSTTSLPELYGRKKKAKTTSTMSRIAYVVRSILGVFGCLYQYWLASVDATFSCLVACVIFSAWPNACKKGPSARLSRNARFELRNSARPGAVHRAAPAHASPASARASWSTGSPPLPDSTPHSTPPSPCSPSTVVAATLPCCRRPTRPSSLPPARSSSSSPVQSSSPPSRKTAKSSPSRVVERWGRRSSDGGR